MMNMTKLEIGKTPANVEELLEQAFWKEKSLVPVALDFLGHIKQWQNTESSYRVSGWQGYCEKAEITQSTYHNMLKKLKNAGMVEKRYNKAVMDHQLYVSDNFSLRLNEIAGIWQKFKDLQ
ncbi:MAG: hypothetical protein MSIBF_00595 [Candidatus Altiarchaeales archaeon IMC4]|nr:MAG: hypothetical protein MSIBF_00595 [Candidatus Altiarchaeales archaeon IMC4]